MTPNVVFYDLVPLVLGLFGLIVGSFLNVCIYRIPRNCLSILSPASRCPECQTPIRWYDNIPVISYFILGGKCRTCGHEISLQYPMVELLNAVLYIGVYISLLSTVPDVTERVTPALLISSPFLMFWGTLFLRMFLISTLIVVSFIDVHYRIIPDVISLPGIVLAVIAGVVLPEHLDMYHGLPSRQMIDSLHLRGFIGSLFGILIGGGLIYAIKIGGEFVFQKPSMGLGDVKLMAFIGGFLGWLSPPIVLVLASISGSVFGLLNLWLTDRHYLPFGPFLSAGATLLLLRADLVQQILELYT